MTDKQAIASKQVRQQSSEALDSDFIVYVRSLLDTSLAQIPHSTQSQLSSAKLAAIESAQQSRATVNSVKQLGERDLPLEIQHSLDGIRLRALGRAARRSRSDALASRWTQPWMSVRSGGVAAFASVCILVTGVLLVGARESVDVVPLAVMEEAWVLASEEELELYENLEFYQWLAENGLEN